MCVHTCVSMGVRVGGGDNMCVSVCKCLHTC